MASTFWVEFKAGFSLGKEVMTMPKSFAHRINSVKKIMAGTEANVESLMKWGINSEFLNGMQQQFEEINQIEDKCNTLKARSQEETSRKEQAMDRLEQKAIFVKRVVRMQFPHETWPEFGFRKGEYSKKSRRKPRCPTAFTPLLPALKAVNWC